MHLLMRSDEQMLPIVAVKITASGRHKKIILKGVGVILNPVFG
jgi:hypothetical protein